MFDTMRIRTKLTVALIIPLVALVGLSWVAISTSNDKADEASAEADAIEAQVELATSSLGPGGVVTALDQERTSESLALAGIDDPSLAGGEQDELRAATDEAIANFTATIGASSAEVQELYAPAIEALGTVEEIRADSDAFDGPRTLDNSAGSAVYNDYAAVIDNVFNANSSVVDAIDDPQLRAGAGFIDGFARYSDGIGRVGNDVLGSLLQKGLSDIREEPAAFERALARQALNDTIKEGMLTNPAPEYAAIAEGYFDNPVVDESTAFMVAALAGEQVDAAGYISSDNTALSQGIADEIRITAADQLTADADALVADARQTADDAANQATLVTFATFLVLGLAVVVTLAASRSITKPLSRLVADAEDMADRRLPATVQDVLDAPLGDDVVMPELQEVPRSGGFEIAEVADALNTVQASAAELAVEQAALRRNISDSFVNLGRRNQNLLSRQLDNITDMEREEADPDQLRKLFTLDHLATRMRRNAESLLLLAGLEPHRQWSAPVNLIDVLRGALGEVEDYERVAIQRLDEATIDGTNAADLTHLVAELLENALNFSPPGRDVELVGQARPDGYTLAIIDNGVGMTDEDLAQANVRLSGGESFTVAPSRYLGHYVVGIQAARLGVGVQLVPTATGGVTAVVDITSVLSTEQAEPTQVDEADAHVAAVEVAEVAEEGEEQHLVPNRFARAQAAMAPIIAEQAAAEEQVVPEATPVAPTPTVAEATPPAGPDAGTTPSGYKKRVRGANTPRTEVLSARGNGNGNGNGHSPEPPASTAEGMRDLLSGLQAGTERGQADARAEQADDESRTEEER